MGTKNNPGKYDCYENADPDEPMFVLLGRDRHASIAVNIWRMLKTVEESDRAKLIEARECEMAMLEWAKKLGKSLPQFQVAVDSGPFGRGTKITMVVGDDIFDEKGGWRK